MFFKTALCEHFLEVLVLTLLRLVDVGVIFSFQDLQKGKFWTTFSAYKKKCVVSPPSSERRSRASLVPEEKHQIVPEGGTKWDPNGSERYLRGLKIVPEGIEIAPVGIKTAPGGSN